jgi:hypothetical protein
MSLSLLFDGTASPWTTAYNSTEGCLICIYHVDNHEKVVGMPRNLPIRYGILLQLAQENSESITGKPCPLSF